MTTSRYFVCLAAAAATLLALSAVGKWALDHWQHDVVVCLMLGMGLVYAAAAWLVRRYDGGLKAGARRGTLVLILGAALGARALLVFSPPLSTDIFRYVWDGEVQAAGINPYRYRPADAPVAFLRDAWVFPNINRADTAVTVYPPFAQLIFRAVSTVSPTVTAMKLTLVGFEIMMVAALLALLRRRGLSPTCIVFYAWHPLPLFEFAGSGHIDVAALALMALACVAVERRSPFCAGGLLGAAALVKFFPLAIAPALYRRWDWRFPAALVAAMILLYVPYLSVGRQVLGFLPGYVHVEGLAAGNGFFLLNALGHLMPLPGWSTGIYLGAGALVLAFMAVNILYRKAADLIAMTSVLLLLAVFTLWMSPHFPWYFAWTLPFLCFRPCWSLIYLTCAAPLLYEIIWRPGWLTLNALMYVPFALLMTLEWRLRARAAGEIA